MQTAETHLDLFEEETYERASTGKRFANYLIDVIVFYVLIIFIGIALVVLFPSMEAFLDDESAGNDLLMRLLSLIFYALYMSVVEMIFKGKSIGKMITKTRAVNLDGSRISPSTAFGRGFSRAVPFCVFSAFGTPCNPWQDRWTDTMVVNDKPVI